MGSQKESFVDIVEKEGGNIHIDPPVRYADEADPSRTIISFRLHVGRSRRPFLIEYEAPSEWSSGRLDVGEVVTAFELQGQLKNQLTRRNIHAAVCLDGLADVNRIRRSVEMLKRQGVQPLPRVRNRQG